MLGKVVYYSNTNLILKYLNLALNNKILKKWLVILPSKNLSQVQEALVHNKEPPYWVSIEELRAVFVGKVSNNFINIKTITLL